MGLGCPPQRVRSWSPRTAQRWAFLFVPPDTSGSRFQIFTWPHFLPVSPANPGIEKEQGLALSLVTDLLPVPRPQLRAASSPPSSPLLQGRQSLPCPDFSHTLATLCPCSVSSCPPRMAVALVGFHVVNCIATPWSHHCWMVLVGSWPTVQVSPSSHS